ncbi:helix-turn-helix domain-containing protein [Coleofasciculus sp. F4-SAH-05]|uniref:helix-turn-helix domain-containing protein n=1 Tax=Coleofasciculus TaxID=669368 RepID=UPI0032FFE5A8
MLVGTKEAAQILGVSGQRVRWLLERGRIKGAGKVSGVWIIPLFDGKPIVSSGKRGPRARWEKKVMSEDEDEDRERGEDSPRGMTIIHVNQRQIRQNHKNGDRAPVITVKRGSSNIYAHGVEITGSCRVVYRPDHPKRCGAKVWIETLSQVKVIGQAFSPSGELLSLGFG